MIVIMIIVSIRVMIVIIVIPVRIEFIIITVMYRLFIYRIATHLLKSHDLLNLS